MEPREKIRRAFDSIYDFHPYLASIVASWKVQEAKVGTAATDGPNLYYDPQFLDKLTIRETTDLILHEAGHVFLGHHFRFEGHHPREWNVAADLALNDNLKEYFDKTGIIFKEGCFPGYHPYMKDGSSRFADYPVGKDAEFYWNLVHKEQQEKKQQRQQLKARVDPNQVGQGTPQESDAQDGNEGQQIAETPAGPGRQTPDKPQKKGSSSKGEDKKEDKKEDQSPGQSKEEDDSVDLPESIGQVLPHPVTQEGDEEEIERVKEEWEQQVAEGINSAKSMGNLPGWAQEMVKTYEHGSSVDWKLLLRQFLTQYAPTNASYTRPNRRASYRTDVIIPAQRSRDLSPGCILVDTSGSMTQNEMNQALAEIEKILSLFPHCEVTLRQSDTRLIEEVDRVFTRFDFPLRIEQKWFGRGGTDLGPAIQKIGQSRKYEWLVVLSDMEWRANGAPNPMIPTLWLITRPIDVEWKKPRFGQVVGPIKTQRQLV